MAIDVWGTLPKSQVDNETIEEAIARLIQAHEDDANAHVEAGESLQSHKAAAIIDHVARSVVTDKIALLGVTQAEIGNQAVETGKIKDLAVDNSKIANLTIETGKIKDLAVTNAKIANATIEDAKIANLTVEKLIGTYITGKTLRTAESGKRVVISGSTNDIKFYDTGGNLGGTILGQSSKIYIGGGGVDFECPLIMEDELIIDTTRSVIPTNTNTYHLGGASYNWDHLYLNALYHGAQQIIDFSGNYLDLYRPLIHYSGALNEGVEGSVGMIYIKGSPPNEEVRVYLNGGWRTVTVV